MLKRLGLVVCALFALFLVVSFAVAQEQAAKTKEAAVTAEAKPVVEAAVNVGNKVCPVSGATIPEADLGKNTVEYEGKIYNLCSAGCKEEFMKDPEKYVTKVKEEMEGEEKGEAPSAEEAAEMPQANK